MSNGYREEQRNFAKCYQMRGRLIDRLVRKWCKADNRMTAVEFKRRSARINQWCQKCAIRDAQINAYFDQQQESQA